MISDIYELSPLQQGMLFHSVYAPESFAYFDQFSCTLQGDVDPDALRQAWQKVVDRHPVLRSSFHWENLDKPVQVVHQSIELPWMFLDWRAQPENDWDGFLAKDREQGFRLDMAPLMRCALIRIDERRYRFCWSHHHLLLDGWCLPLVLSELFRNYESPGAGRWPPHVESVQPFRKYIEWLQRQDYGRAEDHWRQALSGFSTATPFPGREDAGGMAWADAANSIELTEDLTSRLSVLAANTRVTLSTLFQAVWALLLNRYSGEYDVVYGATVSGRPSDLEGVESMLGVFINTIPVRVRIDPDRQLGPWLVSLQSEQATRETFAYLPLTEIQKVTAVQPGAPLFTTNLIFTNYPTDAALRQNRAPFDIRDVHIFDRTESPLTLQVTPGRRVQIEAQFANDRFEEASIRSMLGHLEHLLEEFTSNPGRSLREFEILTAAERAELFDRFKSMERPLDSSTTVIRIFEEQVERTPDSVAVECGVSRLTYREVNERANRFARALMRRMPLVADDRVAILAKRSEKMAIAILAIWKCGAAYVPVDPNYPGERIQSILEGAQPKLVLSEASILALEGEANQESGENLHVRVESGSLAYVIFTSGSTGMPKGAMLEHLGMMNHMLAKIEDFGIDPASVIAQNASHCFDVSVWQFFTALLAGGRTIIYSDDLVLEPAQFIAQVAGDRITILEVVPSYLSALLDLPEAGSQRFPYLRYLIVTGEIVKPALIERWFQRYPGIPVVNAYGPTEACDDVTLCVMLRPPRTPSVPVGTPIRNFHIYIVNEELNLCPVGIKGEICVSGPGVGRGYLNDPERTAAAFLKDPIRSEPEVRMYRTGDVGCTLPDGSILLHGRKDHQVKVRGHRIELGDIETALTRLEGIRDAVVVDLHDRGDLTYLCSYVTLQGTRPWATASILEALSERLPDYMIPAACMILDAMPLTPNGKIDRKALPTPDFSERSMAIAFAGPRNSVEEKLAGIWSDVLGVKDPGIHDNFFALGGDSILSMQIVSRAARAGLRLTPRLIFQNQTIAELAEVAAPSAAELPAAGRIRGPAPLTPTQQQFFESVTIDRHHYNQSVLLEVPADFDAGLFSNALRIAVAHHESLRLRFSEKDGAWSQEAGDAPAEIPIPVYDLEDLDEVERAAELDRVGSRIQQSLDLASGHLVGAAHFNFGPARSGRLIVVIHHLSVDGVSWRILVEDLETLYAGSPPGEAPKLPPVTTSYVDWATRLRESAANGRFSDDLPYWKAAEAQSGGSLPLDPDIDPGGRNLVDSQRDIDLELDSSTTDALMRRSSGAYHTSPSDLLLAALTLTIAGWTGRNRVAIDLETHGREELFDDMDLTRTVGWFTATFPMVLNAASVDYESLIPAIKEQIRNAPSGVGYGLLKPAMAKQPEILFNFHGRTDPEGHTSWRLASEAHGPARSARQVREYVFEINGYVQGGRLHVIWSYGRNLHAEATVQGLVDAFRQHLLELIRHCSTRSVVRWTPSDFPAARISMTSLNRVLAKARDLEDVYELSPTQQGMLFHTLYEPNSRAYFNQLTCELSGPIDVRRFRAAWQRVAERHPTLRTSFHWRDLEKPVQVVHRSIEPGWHIDDWSNESKAIQRVRWQEHLSGDRENGFDLSEPPLMRFTLCQTGPASFLFCWTQHHLLLDGWSSATVLNDVISIYEGRDPGPAPRLFRHHVQWLQRQALHDAESYWRRTLQGFSLATPLILGRPEIDGRVTESRFAEIEDAVDEEFTAGLRAWAAAQQITLNTVFHGVWSILLSRCSGESDVAFGAIVSGRSPQLEGSDRMVGLFINVVPVRNRLDAEAGPLEWFRGLQMDQAEREDYSYSSLADVQRWSDVPGGAPLFESILIFENYPVAESLKEFPGALSVGEVHVFEPNNYPITFVVTPGRHIGLKIMFDEGRFDHHTMKRLLGHCQTVLQSLVRNSPASIGSIPILTESERRLLLEGKGSEGTLSSGQTVMDLFRSRVRFNPDATALICGESRQTYGELDLRVNRLAEKLRGGSIKPGDRVAVVLPRSERLVESVLAIWACGAVYVPVDPAYPAERIRVILENSRVSMVIDVIDESGRRTNGAGPSSPPDLAYVIYTSGSTGAPKGVMIHHAGMLNHVLSMVEDLDLGPGDVVAQTASHCFDISIWQLFAALVSGGITAVYREEVVRQPSRLARQMELDGVSVAQFVPSYLNVFMDELDAVPGIRIESLRWMVTIGEALQHSSVERWFRRFPHIPLMNAYGPTEASDSVTHHIMSRPPSGSAVAIGRPIPNMTVEIRDRFLNLCPAGVKGEICMRGIGVGQGYLFDEGRTREVFVQLDGVRIYRTGDVGCRSSDGTLYFFGRRDNQVKVRGHRIELGEVEAHLARVPGVRDAAVILKDNLLCAFVTRQAAGAMTVGDITTALTRSLPAFAVPDSVQILDALPVTPNGKLDRRRLESLQFDRIHVASAHPQTETECALHRIWAELLERPELGVDDSFFDLGGHSLHAIQIVSRVNREMNRDIGIADLFEFHTVRTLAERIDALSGGTMVELQPAPLADDYPVSHAQKRIWLASQTTAGSVGLNMAGAYCLEGHIGLERLMRAFSTLVERHESLRTVFVMKRGELRQRVCSAAEMPLEFEVGEASGNVERLVEELITQPFDFTRGPLFRVRLLQLGGDRALLLVRTHHIVSDAWSIRQVFQEALQLYNGSTLQELNVQYKDFVVWQNAQGERPADLEYWRAALDGASRTSLETDHPRAATPSRNSGLLEFEIDEPHTSSLMSRASRFGITPYSLTVAAVFALLHRYTGKNDVFIGTQVSGRQHAKLDNQVGCFVNTVVLRGRLASENTPEQLALMAAHVVREGLKHQALPFDRLLEELGIQMRDGRPPLFDVHLDYIPSLQSSALELNGLLVSEFPLHTESAQYDVSFLIAESDSRETLTVRLVYDAALFERRSIEALRDRFIRILEWLTSEAEVPLDRISLTAASTPVASNRIRVQLNIE